MFFSKADVVRTPFGKNQYLRSTQDVKFESYTFWNGGIPSVTIDGDAQKVLQPGTVMPRRRPAPAPAWSACTSRRRRPMVGS